MCLSLATKPYSPDRLLSEQERSLQARLSERVEPEIVEIPGLDLMLEIADPTVVSGATGSGRVVLRNVGPEVIRFGSDR